MKHFSDSLATDVLAAILTSEPHVIVLEGVELLELAERLCQQRRDSLPRLVFDFHNVESRLLQENDSARLPRIFRPLASTYCGRRWLHAREAEVRAVELADQVWVSSAADRARLAGVLKTESLRSKLHVIPNVVPFWCLDTLETPLDEPTRSADSGHALFVGHLKYPPNRLAVDRLLSQIWPMLRARYSRMQLTLAGRRPSKSLRRRVGTTHGVRLLADPSPGDLLAIYRDADMAIIPLEQGSGTRLKALEALALGTPVISTEKAVEGLGLVAGEHWLPAHRPLEYVEQVGRLMESRELQSNLASAGRECVRSLYTPQAIAEPIHELLQLLES